MYVEDKRSFTYVDEHDSNAIRLVQQMATNNGITGFVDKSRLPLRFRNKIEGAGKITINPDQPLCYYQDKEFIGNSVIILDTTKYSKNFCIWLISIINRIRSRSNWNDKFPKNMVENCTIKLPIINGEIDFAFIESFVAELEAQRVAELEAYLTASGLKDYELTNEDLNALKHLDHVSWGKFNLFNLFGKSTRGKRLKSEDRINGPLPFVTAGEADTGISAYIGNNVEVFSSNTFTIDMFGSAKYRNYPYGGDDHVTVVHTEELPKNAAIFVTAAAHKAAHTGQFDYGRNFYAKDADALWIALPEINGEPHYEFMEAVVRVIHRLVIKKVVQYADAKIDATKRLVS